MYYYLYKITNLINNHFYIGIHKTNNMNDGYMGSGDVLKRAYKKYGIKNFKKTILEIFDSFEKMSQKEKEIVTLDFIKKKNTYNIREGGTGKMSENSKRKMSIAKKGKPSWNKGKLDWRKGYLHSEETKKKIGESHRGITNSTETRKKIGESQRGNKNYRAKKVRCVETGDIFSYIGEVKEKYGIYTEHIGAACIGNRKTAGGYHWEYVI